MSDSVGRKNRRDDCRKRKLTKLSSSPVSAAAQLSLPLRILKLQWTFSSPDTKFERKECRNPQIGAVTWRVFRYSHLLQLQWETYLLFLLSP